MITLKKKYGTIKGLAVILYILYNKDFIIIAIHNIVNCEWNDWVLGECTKTCGRGTRNDNRTKKVSDEHGGTECTGPTNRTVDCNVDECPGVY